MTDQESRVTVTPRQETTTVYDITCRECGELLGAKTELQAKQMADHHRRGFHGEEV